MGSHVTPSLTDNTQILKGLLQNSTNKQEESGSIEIIERQKRILLEEYKNDPNFTAQLYAGCPAIETRAARDAFQTYMKNRTFPINKNPQNEISTTMAEFLGEDGLKLYQAAIKEEKNSREFRERVFLSCMHLTEGTENKGGVLYVMGPSGCGKSTAQFDALEEMGQMKWRPKQKNPTNVFVSIDGGVEREFFEVRRDTLYHATQRCRFSDIEDISKYDGAKIKGKIRKAISGILNIGIVIPTTCSNPIALRNLPQEISKFIGKQQRKVFAVNIVPDNLQEMQSTVELMGNSRAKEQNPKYMPDSYSSAPKNVKLCESKKYDSRWFKIGLIGSNFALMLLRANATCYIKKFNLVAVQAVELADNKFQLQKVAKGSKTTNFILLTKEVFKEIENKQFNSLENLSTAIQAAKEKQPRGKLIKLESRKNDTPLRKVRSEPQLSISRRNAVSSISSLESFLNEPSRKTPVPRKPSIKK